MNTYIRIIMFPIILFMMVFSRCDAHSAPIHPSGEEEADLSALLASAPEESWDTEEQENPPAGQEDTEEEIDILFLDELQPSWETEEVPNIWIEEEWDSSLPIGDFPNDLMRYDPLYNDTLVGEKASDDESFPDLFTIAPILESDPDPDALALSDYDPDWQEHYQSLLGNSIPSVSTHNKTLINGDYLLRSENKSPWYQGNALFAAYDPVGSFLFLETAIDLQYEDTILTNHIIQEYIEYHLFEQYFSESDKDWASRPYYAVFCDSDNQLSIYSILIDSEKQTIKLFTDHLGLFAVLSPAYDDESVPLSSDSFQNAAIQAGQKLLNIEPPPIVIPFINTSTDDEDDYYEGTGIVPYIHGSPLVHPFDPSKDQQEFITSSGIHIYNGDLALTGLKKYRSEHTFGMLPVYDQSSNSFFINVSYFPDYTFESQSNEYLFYMTNPDIDWVNCFQTIDTDWRHKQLFAIHPEGDNAYSIYSLYYDESSNVLSFCTNKPGTYIIQCLSVLDNTPVFESESFMFDSSFINTVNQEILSHLEEPQTENEIEEDEEEVIAYSVDPDIITVKSSRKTVPILPSGDHDYTTGFYYNYYDSYIQVFPIDESPRQWGNDNCDVLYFFPNEMEEMVSQLYDNWERKNYYAVYRSSSGSYSLYPIVHKSSADTDIYYMITDKHGEPFFLIGSDLTNPAEPSGQNHFFSQINTIETQSASHLKHPPVIYHFPQGSIKIQNFGVYNGGFILTENMSGAAGYGSSMTIIKTGAANIGAGYSAAESSDNTAIIPVLLEQSVQQASAASIDSDPQEVFSSQSMTNEREFVSYHTVPGSYGYYSIVGGGKKPVTFSINDAEAFLQKWEDKYHNNSLYIVWLDHILETGILTELSFTPASWSKIDRTVTFLPDREGDFLLVFAAQDTLRQTAEQTVQDLLSHMFLPDPLAPSALQPTV